jgi:phosphonate transport system ATP-binding protein
MMVAQEHLQAGPASPIVTPMFELKVVKKRYSGTVALNELSLRIEPGEIVALVGPSGAGKTSLLNLMAAVILPDQGEVRIAGQLSPQLRAGQDLSRLVGIMHQQFDLVAPLPVVHNVLAGKLGEWGLFYSILSLIFPRRLDRVKEALARVGIADKLFERTSNLSGGEQQRVALARLLLQEPRAILADEPVASLDPARSADLIAMLTGIARDGGHTLVASLHTVELALNNFSRIVALRDGRIYFDRPAQEVSTQDLAQLYALGKGE